MKLNVDLTVVQMFRENFGAGWTIEDDRMFWTRIQGRQGLRELRKDAKALEALCRRLSEDHNDRAFMKHRVQLMGICVGLSGFESTARIIYQKLPHFFARFATELFGEMVGRAELVVEEKAPQFLEIFGEMDGQAGNPSANSTPVGRAAPGTPW